jgi:hypothetical protein
MMSAPLFRWESDLSKSFQENACPTLWTRHGKGTWVRAQESTCSEGRADIVWARFEQGWRPSTFRRHAQLLQNSTASRLLAALRQGPAQSEEDLLPRIGVTQPVLRKWLRALTEANFVTTTRDGRFRTIPHQVFPSVEICSFELKLKNWQRALYQATRYRSFSHRVFVVMPTRSAQVAYQHQELFHRANIGLVAHEVSGDSRVLVRPKKRAPHSSYRTIMALGMFSKSAPLKSKQFC